MGSNLRRSTCLLVFLIGTAIGSQISAAVVLDQQLQLTNAHAVDFDYNQELRQSFTVGVGGLVSKFGVQIFRFNDSLDSSGDVVVSIGSSWLPMTTYYNARIPVSQIPVVNSFVDPVPWTYVDVSR